MSAVQGLWCRLGQHTGEWSAPGRRCETTRVCTRCGRTETRTSHVWTPFSYVDTGRCAQIRSCVRCGMTESRTAHEWGPWVYANTEFTSPQSRTCRRCGETERTAYTVR
jgi:hypothetical protein